MSEDPVEYEVVNQKYGNTLLLVILSIGLLAAGVFGLQWLMATKPVAPTQD